MPADNHAASLHRLSADILDQQDPQAWIHLFTSLLPRPMGRVASPNEIAEALALGRTVRAHAEANRIPVGS